MVFLDDIFSLSKKGLNFRLHKQITPQIFYCFIILVCLNTVNFKRFSWT